MGTEKELPKRFDGEEWCHACDYSCNTHKHDNDGACPQCGMMHKSIAKDKYMACDCFQKVLRILRAEHTTLFSNLTWRQYGEIKEETILRFYKSEFLNMIKQLIKEAPDKRAFDYDCEDELWVDALNDAVDLEDEES